MTANTDRTDWKDPMRKFSGPAAGVCVECGVEIDAYESRRFGIAGAVHVWKPNAVAQCGTCLTKANQHKYPYYYTDG